MQPYGGDDGDDGVYNRLSPKTAGPYLKQENASWRPPYLHLPSPSPSSSPSTTPYLVLYYSTQVTAIFSAVR